MEKATGAQPPDLERIPHIPRDGDGPVFTAPWEARAFGMVVHLHAQGHFTWTEWAETLGAEIAGARRAGIADDGSAYYVIWLNAAARLFAAKGLMEAAEFAAKSADVAANPVPPHGKARREAVAIDPGRARTD